MKVLFQNREPNSWIGGDQIQLEKTCEALEKIGVDTGFSSELIASPEYILDADIVHCFNFSMPWTKYQIWNAKKLKKKVVCSMIYHETPDYVDYKTQQAMINEIDAAIFLTQGEKERAKRHLTFNNGVIIPNGIEEWWFESELNPIKCDVLTVGRIDANKGQLAVAKVCNKLGLHYKVIGEPSDYAKLVAMEGTEILPSMSQKELKKHYAGCRIYVQMSYKEVMPLTVMEAGAQEKNIVLTKGCEWNIPCIRAEYNNEKEIEQAIVESLSKPPNIKFKKQLEEMTWTKVAEQLKNLYESISNR